MTAVPATVDVHPESGQFDTFWLLSCPQCSAPLADLFDIEGFVQSQRGRDKDGNPAFRPETVGHVLRLSPGFVNRAKPYATGEPWFHRSKRDLFRPSPEVRARLVVVTCKCGTDVRLDATEMDVVDIRETASRPSRAPSNPAGTAPRRR